MDQLKVLFLAAEAVPYAKVGGLADVAGSLPKALRALGHDVRVALPRYKSVDGARFKLQARPAALPGPGGRGLQTDRGDGRRSRRRPRLPGLGRKLFWARQGLWLRRRRRSGLSFSGERSSPLSGNWAGSRT